MSDTAHRVGMATLYELSLAIGHTPDPYATSRDFLRVLVAHCGLAGAEIWWRDPASQEVAAGMVDQFARPVDPHILTAAILRTLSCNTAG